MKRRVPIYTITFAWVFLICISPQYLFAQTTCVGSLTVPLTGASTGGALDSIAPTIQHVVCYGASTGAITANVVGGSPGYTYSWADNPSINSAMRTSLPAGNYTVYVSDANGCTKTQSFTINQPAATVVATATATANAICNGASTTLQASATGGGGTYTYSWDNGAGTGSSVSVSPTNTTNYTVTVIDQNGCTSTDVVTITVNNNPTVSITNLNSVYCSNAAVINLAGSPSGGSFVVNGSPSPTFNPATAPASNTVAYNYTDGNGCSGSTSKSVSIITHSTVSLAQSGGITSGSGVTTITQACIGTPITLTASVAGPAVTNYQWQRNGVDIVGQTGTSFTTTSGWGVYRVRITNVNTCLTNADTFSISFRSLPNAQAGIDKNICTGTSVVLGATNVSSYVYSWASNMGSFTATISNPTVTPTNTTTTYTVHVSQTMMVGGGPATLTCSKSDDVVVNLLPLPAAPTVAVTAPTSVVGSSVPILCEGSGAIALLASNTTGAAFLQWLKDGVQQTLTTNLTGVYNVSNTNGVTANYTAKVKGVNGCFSPASNTISAKINSAAMPTITPAGTNNIILLCFAGGTSASQLLTASVASGTPTYAWYQSPNTTTPVGTGATYNASVNNTVTSKSFNVRATYSNGCARTTAWKVIRKNTACKEGVEVIDAQLSVYPNPTTGVVTVNLGGALNKNIHYAIYNAAGQIVLEGNWDASKQGDLIPIDMTKLAQGVYHYQISDEYNATFSDKIVKE